MKYFVIVSAAVLMVLPTASSFGQSTQSAPDKTQSNAPIVRVKSSVKRIGFRLTEWKTIHAQTADQAEKEIAALKKIGCEVTSEKHDGHTDINYRCPKWKSMKLTSETLVDQWSSWCDAKGMETVEMNPRANSKKATVQYRLPVPQTVHLQNSEQAAMIITTLKLIGCQVTTNDHGDHIDTTFSCANWLTIALPTEASAHGWQEWLNESGFETKHQHTH